MDTSHLLHNDLTGKILEAAFEVSKELGAGFLETVYERSMQIALMHKGINCSLQVPLKVKFRNVIVGDYFADMLIEGKVIVELKTVTNLTGQHKAQVINYLKATGVDVGLLINFGNPRLEYHRLYK